MAHTWSPLTQCSCQHEKPSTLGLLFTRDGVGVGVVIRSVYNLKLLDLQFFVRTDRFCCPSIKLSAEFAVSEFRAMQQNLMLLSKNWCTTEFGETEFVVIEIGTQHKIWRKQI